MRWRSLLFVPAHMPRFVGRAHERGADGVILDLEDAVPVSEKTRARDALAASIASVSQGGAAALVRVNHGLRHLARDLEAAILPGLAALVLPKVENAGFVQEVASYVGELERERGLPENAVKIVLQIETPQALFGLQAIAHAHPRVAALTLGPEDFCAALGAAPEPEALLGPNLAVLCAARAAGLLPLGFVGSIANYRDLAEFRNTVEGARRMGFRGAMAVHPAQIAILNEGFSPSAAEVAWATRVVSADAKAREERRGAFELDGRMVDAPVVARAREILATAGSLAQPRAVTPE